LPALVIHLVYNYSNFFLFAQFKDDDKKRGAKQIVFFEEKFEDTSFASRGWYMI